MLASSGEITAPCAVPRSLTLTIPSSSTPALSHFWIRRMMRLSPTRCSTKRMSHCWFTGVQYPVHLPAGDSDTERIHRIMRATPRPEPIREPEEVFLVDRVQHCDHGPLDDLVLQSRNRQRALPAVGLRDVDPPRRQCPIRSPMDSCMQVPELALEVRLVVLPCQPVHTRGGDLLQVEERFFEQFDADMVQKRGEPFLLPFLGCLPYALQPL